MVYQIGLLKGGEDGVGGQQWVVRGKMCMGEKSRRRLNAEMKAEEGGEERWKGSRSDKPNMQECAGGAFLGFGKAKNVEKIWGDRKRGGKRLFGANGPQNPRRVFLLRAARYARVPYLLV